MEESPTDKSAPENREDHLVADAQDDAMPTGMEISLGDFTRTNGLLKSLRLVIENRVVVQVDELAAGVSDAGRKWKMGDVEQANQDVARLYGIFGQRTNQWENQARSLEQQLKAQAVKSPKSVSINRINQVKAEQTAVRSRIRTAEIQFRRLHQGLDWAYTNLQRYPTRTDAESNIELPTGFLEQFQAAAPTDRPDIVKQHFDIEAILAVQVSKAKESGYAIKFSPLPPLNRLYFVTTTAQMFCLQQLDKIVVVRDMEADESREMKVVKFVRLVQKGMWLLKTRAAAAR